jgi:AcrR family transcriptional regulator
MSGMTAHHPPAAVPGRRDRHKLRTREAIEAAAATLFDEHGFDATTVGMIAERADISERTFFRYFESKDDLLLADVVRALDDAIEELRRRPAEERPMVAMWRAMAAVARRRGAPVTALGIAQVTQFTRPRTASRLFSALLEWESRLAVVFAARAGAVTAASSVEARVAAGATTAGLRCAIQQLVLAGEHERTTARFERELKAVFELLDAGCAPAG